MTQDVDYKTYVGYTTRRKNSDNAVHHVDAVDSRDLRALKLPKNTIRFHFFDAPAHITNDVQSYAVNPSPDHVIAVKVYTSAQARALMEQSTEHQRKCADTTLAGKLTHGQIYKAVFDTAMQSYAHHALGRDGALQNIYKDDIVVDTHLNVLQPPLFKKPRALRQDFSGALKKPVKLIRPIQIVRRGP